jgi:hypothetical protein
VFLVHVQEDYDISFMPPTVITINVPLILIVRDVIFMRAKHIISDFEGFFEGGQDFGVKKVADYVYVCVTKNIITNY